ncbi:hypothetical protein CPHO_01560 [Corynebacterium phocae]|uniref:HNH nuclease domain-containing protein n=1 Tax=Corynebacterium phocae TaxID=161895 RepID=A0A1L7D661_9CORY|nr:HNH endonuclease signature motif containing protein [Corynebacterium phocae]APT93595.1 hypothetical protein CPHO_01560 [Corynebacterium phocae]KAA8727955.1 HNH endonuclease [Corynebacterium phocae]
MNLDEYANYVSRGLTPVEQAHGRTEEELLALFDSAHALTLRALGAVYFGETPFTGKQRTARRLAGKHSLTSLINIERHAGREKHAREIWDLRLKLCAVPAQRVDQVAKDHFAAKRKAKGGPEAGVRVTRRGQGNNTLSLTAKPSVIADMLGVLDSVNAQDRLQAAEAVFFEKSGGSLPAVSTNIIITLEDWAKLVSGDGAELTLQLTNGSTLTGKEYLERRLADQGFVTLVDPVEGPVNLYRIKRFASWKQRTMIAAKYPHCVWPDCHKPADECEFHHIDSWQGGGFTNVDNLVPMCAYHNGVNEDSGPADSRGKVVRIDGEVAWVSPRTGTPRFAETAF